MKVFIYQTNNPCPFDDQKLLGSQKRIFFSKQKPFNGSEMRANLPLNPEDESVFVVPDSWKDELHQLLTEKFPHAKWQEEQPLQKPPKEEIGSGWSEELTRFYNNDVTILNILTIKQKENEGEIDDHMDDENELKDIDRHVSQRILTSLSFIVATFAILFLLFPMTDLGETNDLKERQFSIIPVLLDKAKKAKEEEDMYKMENYCKLAKSISEEKTTFSDKEKVCNMNANELATQPTENVKELENQINDLADQAQEAISKNNLITIGTTDFEMQTESNGTTTRSAFNCAKEIWNISHLGKKINSSLRVEKTKEILKNIVEKYITWHQRGGKSRCDDIKKIYDFVISKKTELEDTKNFILNNTNCPNISPSVNQ